MAPLRTCCAVVSLALLPVTSEAKSPSTPSVWAGCGETKVSGFATFMVGPTAARHQNPKATPEIGIVRCTEALQALDAAAPWQRRSALLRSRAKYHLKHRDAKAALADLDSIAAIEKPDLVYARSFGLSTHMLRAVAKLGMGDRDSAASEALAAIKLRPWSKSVGQFAFAIYALRNDIPIGDAAHWDNLLAIDSSFVELRASLRAQGGDWSGATADWLRSALAPGEIGVTYIEVPNVVVNGAPGFPIKAVDVQRTVNAILTAAMAGRIDLADAWLTKLRTNIDAPPPPDGFAKREGIAAEPAAQKAELEKWMGLIEVAKAAGGRDAATAVKLLSAMPEMPISSLSTAMIRALAAKTTAPADAPLGRVLAAMNAEMATMRAKRVALLLSGGALLDDLPDHEEIMLANPYRSAVKFLRANGSSVKLAKDGKTAQIAFFGNKSQPFAIGEMTLLRAAELALEKQYPAFRIVSSNEYVHTSTLTMYGSPIGQPTVSGSSVSMSIEFVDPSAPGAINAASVRGALGPIYIKEAADEKS